MTFREKLAKEHPECIDKRHVGGCKKCPYTYGYEILNDSDNCPEDGDCTKCWDREMPKTYEDGLQDAWELLRTAYDMKCFEVAEVFGGSIDTFYDVIRLTPQEALAKLKAYEEAQKIKVGDVIERNEHKFVIVSVEGEYATGLNANGRFSYIQKESYKKTGKHIDIESLLEQIKGDANE